MELDEWMVQALVSCLLYALDSLLAKQVQLSRISSDEMLLIQAPLRMIVVASFVKSWENVRFFELPMKGAVYIVLATVATVSASFQYQNALRSGGSGATVSAIVGAYPALAYLVGIVLGMEEVTRFKILGIIFSTLSCICFAL